MGTKQEPGANDVQDRIKDDEPFFTLAGRDPIAPFIIRLWAAALARDIGAIEAVANNLAVAASKLPYRPDKDPAHVREARAVATAMELWLIKNSPRPARIRGIKIDAPMFTPARGSFAAFMDGRNVLAEPSDIYRDPIPPADVRALWEGSAHCGVCNCKVACDPATGIIPACTNAACPFHDVIVDPAKETINRLALEGIEMAFEHIDHVTGECVTVCGSHRRREVCAEIHGDGA